MKFHILVLLLFVSSLFAEVSLTQAKQMVKNNPALLETPQAKAAMKEKGVTLNEVKTKLAQDSLPSETTTQEDIDNTIDISVEESQANITKKQSDISQKRVNPFSYTSSEKMRAELKAKQQIEKHVTLHRYSSSFYANKNKLDAESLPTPNEYVISTGDVLGVYIYGDRDRYDSVTVKSDGTINLKFIGPLKLAGMKFIDAKKYLVHRLKAHYKNSKFDVYMDKYSTIQATLIGDVKYPGLYNLSSFSTVKDLLIVAKGVKDTASVREIVIKRDGNIVATLDFYDLLFKGNKFATTLLEQGDIVIIKKAEKLVSIDGYVNSAAIIELKNKQTLKDLIEYAGGLKPEADKSEIKVQRYSDNTKTETFKVSYKESQNFKMKNGDRVYIYPLDFTAQNSINVYGNVIRPGTYGLYHNTESLNQFFKTALKSGNKKFFLPNTYFEYGLIMHYSDNLEYESRSFNLSKVIKGEESVKVFPNDKIYIFSVNDIFTSLYITTKGATLIKPGKKQYIAGMTIQDAVNASGVKREIDDRVRVTTYNTEDYMPETSFYSLKKDGNKELSPFDEIELYDYYTTHMLEPIIIKGEVTAPSNVYYEKNMTAADLLHMAGGFKHTAYTKSLSIVRYYIDEEQTRKQKILNFDLTSIKLEDIKLQPYDEVTIYKIPQWSDRRVVTLQGEVRFPGTYTIQTGEKLSSVIKRAGGFTSEAFLDGAVFTRESIKERQIKQYNASLARIKRELAIYNAMPANAKRAQASVSAANTLNEVVEEAQKYQPVGRVSIVLDNDLDAFEQSQYNLVLKDQDTITLPSSIDTVTVFGEVFNPTSFIYVDSLDAEDYIAMASGVSRSADEASIYVIHANGMSEPVDGGWFSPDAKIKRGDTIVVPIYIKENNQLDIWDSVSRILASFAVTIATLNTLGVF